MGCIFTFRTIVINLPVSNEYSREDRGRVPLPNFCWRSEWGTLISLSPQKCQRIQGWGATTPFITSLDLDGGRRGGRISLSKYVTEERAKRYISLFKKIYVPEDRGGGGRASTPPPTLSTFPIVCQWRGDVNSSHPHHY